jgi:hypothetical protein
LVGFLLDYYAYCSLKTTPIWLGFDWILRHYCSSKEVPSSSVRPMDAGQ